MLSFLLVYLISGLAAVLPGLSARVRLRLGGAGCAVASLCIAISGTANLVGVVTPSRILQFAAWPLGAVEFGGDSLSWFFSVMVGLLGAVASLYALGYRAPGADLADDRSSAGLMRIGLPVLLLNLFVLSMQLVVLATTALAFLGAWELMALSSYLLIVQGAQSERARSAGFTYVVMTHIGTAFVIIAFMLLHAATGSFSFNIWAERGPSLAAPLRLACFALLAVGLGTKGGLVPLQVWLPRAHPEAPSHVSALMSGVMVKMAVYGFIRLIIITLGAGDPWWGLIVLGVGLVSGVVGILGAQAQSNMKKLLAYSTVENMGLITVGLGCTMLGTSLHLPGLGALGLTAALAHSFGHSLFKGLLFLGTGSVLHSTGTCDLSRLGGLSRKMPVTSIVVLVGLCSIVALPPFVGFISEWYLLKSTFLLFVSQAPSSYRMAGFVAAGAVAFTGGIAAATFLRFFGVAFLGRARSAEAASAHDGGWQMVGPMALLAFLCLLFGLVPGLVIGLAGRVVEAVGLPPVAMAHFGLPLGALLALPLLVAGLLALAMRLVTSSRKLERSETWNCGFPLEPTMQYSSGGFSQPFARTFGFRPVLEQRVYAPVRDWVLASAVSLRRIQSGSIQAYIGYILATLVVLVILARGGA